MMKKLVFLMAVMLSFSTLFAQSRVIVLMTEKYDDTQTYGMSIDPYGSDGQVIRMDRRLDLVVNIKGHPTSEIWLLGDSKYLNQNKQWAMVTWISGAAYRIHARHKRRANFFMLDGGVRNGQPIGRFINTVYPVVVDAFQ